MKIGRLLLYLIGTGTSVKRKSPKPFVNMGSNINHAPTMPRRGIYEAALNNSIDPITYYRRVMRLKGRAIELSRRIFGRDDLGIYVDDIGEKAAARYYHESDTMLLSPWLVLRRPEKVDEIILHEFRH